MAVFIRLAGLSDYSEVHGLQKRLVEARAGGDIPDVVLLLEHAEVITVGRKRGALSNVLVPGEVPVVEVERGGDVTWHGPGQLVAYPILQLQGLRADLHLHLRSLEEAAIRLLGGLGLTGIRDERNTGVWLPDPPMLPSKVCSVGIACRRWVSWHGLALNVTTDLSAFKRINPCGFGAEIITRVADHLQQPVSLTDLVEPLANALAVTLEVEKDSFIKSESPDEAWRSLTGS